MGRLADRSFLKYGRLIMKILIGIVVTILGMIYIVYGFAIILEEIKILNENIYKGIVFLISGYVAYKVSSYTVKILRETKEKDS